MEYGQDMVKKKVVQETMDAATDDIQAMLDNAASLRELGMVEEAVVEYEKLFDTDCPPIKIIPGLVACLSKTKSPHSVVQRVENVINDQGFDDQKIARIRFYLGLETERGGYMDLALDLYKRAAETDPENSQVQERLEGIISRLSKGSKYDYLIHKNLVTQRELQTALGLSKKMRKSVEFVLMQQFKVKKSDIGKSLSLFHGCPFKYFKADMTVPVELIRNFKKAFLLHDLWVPIGWDAEGVEVLIDDPGDLRKTSQIKGLTKSNKIRFCVGIKEDIEQCIILFFDKAKEEKSVRDMQEMMDELSYIPDISFEEEEEALTSTQEEVDESSSQVVKLVDQFIVTALRKNASDIHVEPSPIINKTQIRFRLDGVCQEYLEVPNSLAKGILSRLKIMAGLDIAERRLPQDGKIKFRRKGVPPV
ncbi:MAG: GspE/PulE family protein, partial [Desulfobacteraceae bacterium]